MREVALGESATRPYEERGRLGSVTTPYRSAEVQEYGRSKLLPNGNESNGPGEVNAAAWHAGFGSPQRGSPTGHSAAC